MYTEKKSVEFKREEMEATKTTSAVIQGLKDKFAGCLRAPRKGALNAAIQLYGGFQGIIVRAEEEEERESISGVYSIEQEVLTLFSLFFLLTGTLDKSQFADSILFKDLSRNLTPAEVEELKRWSQMEPDSKKRAQYQALIDLEAYSEVKRLITEEILDSISGGEVILKGEALRALLSSPGDTLQPEER